jgi:hypothetical protein
MQDCHGKSSIQQEGDSFHQQIGHNSKEETSKVLYLEHSLVWCWNLDTSESRSKIPGKFWNVVLEKDGEDQLDWSCEKWRSITESQRGEEYPTHSETREG